MSQDLLLSSKPTDSRAYWKSLMTCMGPSRTTLSNWVHYLLSSTSSASRHLLTKTQNHQVGSNTVVRVPTLKEAVTTLGVKSCQATPLFVPGSWTFLEQHSSGDKETNVTRWISRGGIKEPSVFLVLNTEPFSTDGHLDYSQGLWFIMSHLTSVLLWARLTAGCLYEPDVGYVSFKLPG